MIRLKDTSQQNTASFLANAIRVAEYYGFVPLDEIPRQPRKPQPISVRPEQDIVFARRDERTLPSAAKRLALSMRLTPDPAHPIPEAILAWRTVPIATPASGIAFELHIAGVNSSIAEALLIAASDAIAREAGISQRVLSINNMGSPETSSRYVRDIGTYLRKHLESISPSLRPRVAVDPLGALIQLIERGHPATGRAPQAMEYLSEEERRRFWELLDYLEASNLAYELNAHILGSRDCWSQSLYEIATVDPETGARMPYALGGRYDPLISRFARTPVHAAMIAIHCEVRGAARPKRQKQGIPGIYFAHLGPEARRRSLPLLEELRQAGIPISHGLWSERIAEQMTSAKSLAAPYILIMGHKEAVEGTVLVREVATNSQEAVPVPDLTTYLKRHRLSRSSEVRA